MNGVEPEGVPLHSRTQDGPGLWGMGLALLADAALYMSLLFGWFYLWTVAADWQAPEQMPLALPSLLASGVALGIAAGFYHKLVAQLRRGRGDSLRSEEHTSELQSRGHLVCRLLLEKKKR